ncbi:MAG: tetratricopeptide repeat protein [Kofleriaceae bacterium]
MNTDSPAAAAPPETGVLLEQETRLSESVLWTLQRQYYATSGPNAWHSGDVPSYATCNTYIAQAYAHVVLAYLRDARAAGLIDPGKPVYIVELAAGVGRFAYLFLHKFHQLKNDSSLRGLDVRYVMTDFARANIQAWSEHPMLRPFTRANLLDFGTFDVDKDREITLLGGQVLSAQTVANPIVVLANYAFDTFRFDLFRIANGALHEVHLTTRAPHGASPDPSKLDISKLRVQYGHREIGSDYYEDPAWNQLLADYRSRLADVTIGMPIGGMMALRSLLEISGRRMLLLSSDKGFTHEDELFHPEQHNMQFHAGAFSMMVNYHAIGQYFRHHGGQYVATSRRYMNLKTVACLVGGAPEQFVDTLSAFQERVETFGPGDFFELLQAERQDVRSLSVDHFLGLLRMSHWDPGVVWQYVTQVRELASGLTEGLALELRLALERTWKNLFPGPQNLPFELARIFMALKRPHDAIRFNQIALEWSGEQPATYLNMGVCYYYSENPQEALKCFHRALGLNPEFGIAKSWVSRVLAELERGGTGGDLSAANPALEAIGVPSEAPAEPRAPEPAPAAPAAPPATASAPSNGAEAQQARPA